MAGSLSISIMLSVLLNNNLNAQSGSVKTNETVSTVGYFDRGDTIEFVFGQQQTIRIGTVTVSLEKRINEIKEVNLAGDFNGWDPNATKYKMHKAGTLFRIKLAKATLGKTGELRRFKFVLNHKYWVEPPPHATNTEKGKDGNTNLTFTL